MKRNSLRIREFADEEQVSTGRAYPSEKRGRPAAEKPLSNQICLRMTDKDMDMLWKLCNETGMKKTRILREALRLFYCTVMEGKGGKGE